jgi:hypothetical protein
MDNRWKGLFAGLIIGFIVFLFTKYILGVGWPDTCSFWTPVIAGVMGLITVYFIEQSPISRPGAWFLAFFVIGSVLLAYVVDPGYFGLTQIPWFDQYVVGVAAGFLTIGALPLILS